MHLNSKFMITVSDEKKSIKTSMQWTKEVTIKKTVIQKHMRVNKVVEIASSKIKVYQQSIFN